MPGPDSGISEHEFRRRYLELARKKRRDRMGTVALLIVLFLACESFDPPTGPRGDLLLSDCDPADAFPTPIMDGGGLYGGGSNIPPSSHHAAGLTAASQVPASGAVFVAVGMSITRAIFESWMIHSRSYTDAVMVDGACGGCTVTSWDELSDTGWQHAFSRLAAAGKTPQDVDVVWMSVTRDQTVAATAGDLEAILVRINQAFPNVRQVFVSNRTYGGWRIPVTAEQEAWKDGLAVRGLVLNHLGETNPWVGWAGDLWTHGDAQRSDGLSAPRADFSNDGLHYSTAGTIKWGEIAWQQFAASPYTAWYQP